MSTKPAVPRSLADEVFDDLDKRWKAPDPEAVGGQVERFDRFLSQLALPLVGINAYLVGSLVYRSTTQLWAVPALLGVLALLVWALVAPARTRRASPLHLGGVVVVILMLLLAVPHPGAAWMLGLTWAALVAGAIWRHFIPDRTLILFVLYLPLLAEQAFDGSWRLTFEMLTLLPLTAWMVKRKARKAALACLVGCAIAGTQALSWMPRGDAMLVILCTTLVLLAIAYEWRLDAEAESSLRQFVGQGVTAMASLLAFAAVLDLGQDQYLWAWAATLALFQIVKMTLERLARPTRIAWGVYPLIFCVWFSAPKLGWDAKVLSTLLLASSIHVIANATSNRFAATLALLPGAAMTGPLLKHCSEETSLRMVVVGLAVAGFLWLSSRTRPDGEALPAWRGFLAEGHAQRLRSAALAAVAQVLRIPLVSTAYGLLRRSVTWVRYMKGSGEPLAIGDVSLIAAHATATWVLSQQISRWATHGGDPAGVRVALAAAAWVFWGLGLYWIGCRRERVFDRLLGVCFVVAPAILVMGWVARDDRTAVSLVVIVAGAGAWLAGASARRAQATTVSSSAVDEGETETG